MANLLAITMMIVLIALTPLYLTINLGFTLCSILLRTLLRQQLEDGICYMGGWLYGGIELRIGTYMKVLWSIQRLSYNVTGDRAGWILHG